MVDREIISIVPMLSGGVKAERATRAAQRGEESVEASPRSEIEQQIELVRADDTRGLERMPHGQSHDSIAVRNKAGGRVVAIAGEEDDPGGWKGGTEIGDDRADEDGVADRGGGK